MLKFISKQNKPRKTNPLQPADDNLTFKELRYRLQNSENIAKQMLEENLTIDRVATTKEILFFQRYEEFKNIIDKYIKQEEIEEHRDLGAIYDQYLGLQDTTNVKNRERKEKKEERPLKPSPTSEQLKKIVATIAGIIIFIFCIVKRRQLWKISKKILL